MFALGLIALWLSAPVHAVHGEAWVDLEEAKTTRVLTFEVPKDGSRGGLVWYVVMASTLHETEVTSGAVAVIGRDVAGVKTCALTSVDLGGGTDLSAHQPQKLHAVAISLGATWDGCALMILADSSLKQEKLGVYFSAAMLEPPMGAADISFDFNNGPAGTVATSNAWRWRRGRGR